MYEHRKHRLLSWPDFLRRAGSHALRAIGVLLIGVGIGTVGYKVTLDLDWVEAFSTRR